MKILMNESRASLDKLCYAFFSVTILCLIVFCCLALQIDFGIDHLKEGSVEKNLKIFLINHIPTVATKTSGEIRKKVLDQKLSAGLPEWATAQIQEDLSKFQAITTADLDLFFEKNKKFMRIVRFKIKDGKINLIGPETGGPPQVIMHREVRVALLDILEFLLRHHYIPKNLDFIVDLSDFAMIRKEKLLENKPVPVFTFAKDALKPIEKDLILIPDWMNLRTIVKIKTEIKEATLKHPWDSKQSKAFWRGGPNDETGFRKKIVAFSKLHPEIVDASFSYLKKNDFITPADQLKFKYLLMIDGARGAWERFVWQLQANSLVMKHNSTHIQWYYKGVQPYIHYIPIQDEQDLTQKIAWAETHPDEVLKIITNANNFAEANFSLEDFYHYYIVLLNQYGDKVSKNLRNS